MGSKSDLNFRFAEVIKQFKADHYLLKDKVAEKKAFYFDRKLINTLIYLLAE